jgi:hypothetical protein
MSQNNVTTTFLKPSAFINIILTHPLFIARKQQKARTANINVGTEMSSSLFN